MKPHPKLRKTIKWGGAALTMLLVAVGIGSGWWTVSWIGRSGIHVGAIYGRLIVRGTNRGSFGGSPGTGWYGGYMESQLGWWFDWRTTPRGWSVEAPFWLPSVISLLVTAVAWRLDTLARRRARLNLCPKCNYDRAGITGDAKCPECGSAAP